MALLFNRSLLLAKKESTFRTDSTPDETNNAKLVIDLDYKTDPTILDRANATPHLSPLPGMVGRILATVTFQHEVRGSGNHVTTAPSVGTLLEGCGMVETQYSTTATILDSYPIPINEPVGTFTFTKTAAYAGALPRMVVIVCTMAGGSGVAQFTVHSPASGAQTAITTTGVVMTNAMPFVLAESASITPTIGTAFTVGDTYAFALAPPGFYYTPVSTSFASLTLYNYFDGLRHRTTGARGTWTLDASAGQFALFSFTYTGDYNAPTDTAFPSTPVFENTVPPTVENAAMAVIGGRDFAVANPDEFNLCAQQFTIDIGNDVVARDCINEPQSYAGGEITGRKPTGTMNPEAALVADFPAWATLQTGDRVYWSARVGVTAGNVMVAHAPYAQFTSVNYADRNNIRVFDIAMRFAAGVAATGNDELRLVFC